VKAISYKKDLLEQLKDPEYAQAYLEQTVATGDRAAAQLAINDVIEANATKATNPGKIRFILSDKQWEAFQTVLNAPARNIPALKRLLTQPSVFERK
jgi:hypothetical protein